MNYQSPIHLISDKDLDDVTPENLKKWRKELLLRFSMTAETVISVNGKEYDKQGINDAFEELKNDFDMHIDLYRNPSILAFIESGDLEFFKNQINKEEPIYENLSSKTHNLMFKMYGEIVNKTVERPSYKNLSTLLIVVNSGMKIEQDKEAEFFAEGFNTFEKFIEKFKIIADDCYFTDRHCSLRSEIFGYVNEQIRELIRLLPKNFDPLKQKYAAINREKILLQTFGNNSDKVFKADKNTLDTLLTSALIDKNVLNKPDTYEMIKTIKQKLSGEITSANQKNGKGFNSTFWIVLVIIFIFIRLYFFLARNN